MGRPHIPAAIKREVRQRCGHGCVFCGLPLYEYDHIVDWSETQRHVADEITLLCNEHHARKTRGLLTREMVQEANGSPHNVAAGVTAPFGLHFSASDEVEMVVGGDSFKSTMDLYPIVVDNIPLLGFLRSAHGLALHVHLRDRYNLPVLSVDNNELMMVSDLWDIQFVGQQLTLHQAAREILVRLRFEPPSRVVVSRARMMCNGVLIDVDEDTIRINGGGGTYSHNWYELPVGITVGHCPDFRSPFCMLRLNVNRYGTAPREGDAS